MVLECTCASQGISRTLSTVPSASSASKDDIKKGRPHVAFVPAPSFCRARCDMIKGDFQSYPDHRTLCGCSFVSFQELLLRHGMLAG